LIPRRIAITCDRFPIQPRSEWAALLIARLHQFEDQAVGEWTCDCRCCRWARERQEMTPELELAD